MKIVFMGTPHFAVPCLEKLIDSGYDVAAVITQPDRKSGRGHKMTPPPVKAVAENHGIDVLQFERIKTAEGVNALKALSPDIIVTAAFGQILSREILDIPPMGCINVHASLLPKYRGAAPIQWAIIEGETQSGVTIMYMDVGLDTGDIIAAKAVGIDDDMTGGMLYEQLAIVGADLLVHTISAIENGTANRTAQNDADSSYYPPLSRQLGEIDWQKSAHDIRNLIRGLNPVMSAYAHIGSHIIKLWQASVMQGSAVPGEIVCANAKDGLIIGTGDGLLRIEMMQAPGKRKMAPSDYLLGTHIAWGAFRVISARRASYNALTAVTQQGAYTALAIKKHIPSELPVADKRFASVLLRTTLENLMRIDFALGHFIQSGRVHGSVRNVLRLGACQILFLETEGYAAVSESVKLVKKIKPQMSGFVNGVLRNLERGKQDVPYPQGQTAMALSIAHSYPLWMCEKYIADFGYAFTEALFSHKPASGTVVRLNTLKTTADALLRTFDDLGFKYTAGTLPNTYIVKNMTGIDNLSLFHDGYIAVQSESAMKAVLSMKLKPNTKLLDCCAAPGGKSAYAATLTNNTLDIVAWDIHQHRIDMMDKNFERLGVKNMRTALHDARKYEQCLVSAFDAVMIDAPCSAMGLMARNPDIRYVRTQKDIASIVENQREILSTCAKYVKPGGTLAYFTCSINTEENENVTNPFVCQNDDFEYAAAPKTLYPHIDGSDGFYIAIMKRNL